MLKKLVNMEIDLAKLLCQSDGVNSFSIDYEFEFKIAEKYLNGETNLI